MFRWVIAKSAVVASLTASSSEFIHARDDLLNQCDLVTA